MQVGYNIPTGITVETDLNFGQKVLKIPFE
jgi:hypothetical protein